MKLSSVKPKGKDTDDGMPGRSGPTIHLSHDHMKAMGMDTPLSHGTEVHFEGHGHVSDVSSHEGMDGGEPSHHMTITLHKAGMEHDEPAAPGGGLRDELKKNTDKQVTSRSERKVTDRADKANSSGAAKTEVSKAEPKVKG
jgi:hypothetical protein